MKLKELIIKAIRKATNRKYKTQIISFIILFGIIIAITLSTVSYLTYNNIITKYIGRISEQMMTNSIFHAESLMRQTFSIALEVIGNENTNQFFNSKTNDYMIEYNSFRYINKLKTTYPFIKSISLYNDKLEWLMGSETSPGEVAVLNQIIEQHRLKDGTLPNSIINARRVRVFPNDEEGTNTISIILLENKSAKYSNAVIIEIFENSLHQNAQSEDAVNNEFFVVNKKGIVVSHIRKEEISKDYNEMPFIEEIISESSPEKGSFKSRINNKDYLVYYEKSSLINGVFINAYPISGIRRELRRVQFISLIILIIFILFSVPVAAALTKRLYRPVDKALSMIAGSADDSSEYKKYDELSYISQKFEKVYTTVEELNEKDIKNHELLKIQFLRNILIGEMKVRDIVKGMRQYYPEIPMKNIRVVLIEVDRFNQIDFDKIFVMQDILDRIYGNFEDYLKHEPILTNQGAYAMILSDFTEDEFSRIEKIINSDSNCLKMGQTITVSAAVSSKLSGVHKASEGYAQCIDLLKYRLKYGGNSLLFWDNIKQIPKSEFFYPEDIEKSIIASLRTVDSDKFKKSVDDLITCGEKWTVDNFSSVIMQIIFNALKQINSIYSSTNTDIINNYKYLANSLNQTFGKEELKKWFDNIFVIHKRTVIEINESKSMKNKRVITDLVRYIHHNFSDTNISAENISDMVNLSTSYFSRIFKEYMKKSFTDYLAEIRLSEAKKLLKESELSISEISSKCGLMNVNYFHTFFKKHTGLTPAQFREAHKH